ncbi:hypothetical protein F0562_021197 [Nyssa sinensis]|uniref:Uncharacterized protein n=1 Tax=Nyssa sinensis TaxID=561372 RepID=A0A5J5BKY2_9ASTE|nr:hypothetical protein F0562_021197 [Nyssa sinensis]
MRRKTNYLIVDSKTTVKQIEDAFKEFTTREDIAIVLISQYVANMIRFLVDSYNRACSSNSGNSFQGPSL